MAGPGLNGMNGFAGMHWIEWLGWDGPKSFAFDLMGQMAGPGLNSWAGTGPISFAFDLMGCMAGRGRAGLNGLAGMGWT